VGLGFREWGAKYIQESLKCYWALFEFTSQSTISRAFSLNLWNFCSWCSKFVWKERGKWHLLTTHVFHLPPRGRFKEKLWKQKCSYIQMLLCLYENEYLVCEAKNSSNGNGKSNTHVSWSLQSYETAFIQTSLLTVTPKILLKTKCSPSKWFANFQVTLKLWRMVVKFKPRLPWVSSHCCSEIMKKLHAFKTPLSCHKWNFKNKKLLTHESFKPHISHVRVENEKMVGGRWWGM
jgi:hypothetical protein